MTDRIANWIKGWGAAPAEIESYLRHVCVPSQSLYNIAQTAERLHISQKKVRAEIKNKKLETSPISGRVTDESIAAYLGRTKQYKIESKRDSLILFINEISQYRKEMEFDFDGREWLPVSGESWAGIFWGKASVLFMDLNKYPDRLKECAAENCFTLFWDESRNKSALYCEDPICVNKRNYEHVKKHRTGKSKVKKK